MTEESPLQRMFRKTFESPYGTLGYFSAQKGTLHKPDALRALFNHAGRPVPKDLQETTADTYEMPRKDLAGLVYQAARKNGYGVISSASQWLKTRLG